MERPKNEHQGSADRRIRQSLARVERALAEVKPDADLLDPDSTLDSLAHESRQLDSLLDSLLEAATANLRCDLNQVTRDAIEEVYRKHPGRGLLRTCLAEGLPTARMAAIPVHGAVAHCLEFALGFSGPRGEVEIGTRVEGYRAILDLTARTPEPVNELDLTPLTPVAEMCNAAGILFLWQLDGACIRFELNLATELSTT